MRLNAVFDEYNSRLKSPRLSGAKIFLWLPRRQTRARLALLDDHLLRDIGLDRESVQAECRKWFWQA